MQTVTTEATGN